MQATQRESLPLFIFAYIIQIVRIQIWLKISNVSPSGGGPGDVSSNRGRQVHPPAA